MTVTEDVPRSPLPLFRSSASYARLITEPNVADAIAQFINHMGRSLA
jgi:hypothetical protein